MSYRIYVGNLSYRASEQELQDLFGSEGSRVEAVKIVNDFNTGKSRGEAKANLEKVEKRRATHP